MQSGLRRAKRYAEDGRCLGQRHPKEEVQDDDGAPRWVEPSQGIVDQLSIDDVGSRITGRRLLTGLPLVRRRELDLEWPSAPAAQDVDAGPDEKAMEPSVERTRVAQPGQVSPSPDERFLDRVGGKLSISENQPRGCVQPCDARADELGEGVMIALPGPLHESPLVHGCLSVPAQPIWRARMVSRTPGVKRSRGTNKASH